MSELDDHQLLAEFARDGSDAAFAALVSRYVNLVYSTALRKLGNAHAAEEITQAVFIILARKAGTLPANIILPGWLHQSARLTAANYVRGEIRRQQREQEAYMQSPSNEPDVWPQIAPLLDDALAKLPGQDRNALVLRFFENKSLAEVGAALGASEGAAKMRVARALDKLRKLFEKRGVVLTATALGGAVSANAVQAAPAGLLATASGMAKGSFIAENITTLAKGTMKTMAWLKLKTVMVAVAAALLLASMVMVALSPGAGTDGFQLRLVVDAASADSEVLTISNTNRASGQVFQETLRLQKQALLGRSAIQSASVSTNSINGRPDEYSIGFTLTAAGQKQFAEITRANIGRRLAIVIDGKIISAPRINSEISSGNGQISGNFTAEEAARLATILSKGANK